MKSSNGLILVTCVVFGVFGFSLVGQETTKKAPKKFLAKFETTCGDFVIEVQREWAPNGADRFYQLVNSGFYDDCKFFRVKKGFMVQFGIPGDPKLSAKWENRTIKDDPVVKANKRGFVTFAKQGLPNTRTTQVFINFDDNSSGLDSRGFAPFGKVVEGMDTVVDKINDEYGENAPEVQGMIRQQGNVYLNSKFPNLDGIKRAVIVDK